MMTALERGVQVIVRTHGGFPCMRKLWSAGRTGCVVAEDEAFDRLLHGDVSGAVGIPTEDVFRYDQNIALALNPLEVFLEWDKLEPYVGS